ncbi:Carboxypeptidase Q [Orchesella cincta]|uniref:Carboxypeptidase Q n=1 Tax=Orchesella cincta TaxID=48709 RepID=A0A1D2NF34_ORCCI|nr:Carboxypeptidase Q [Orchesella cincta]
MLKINPRFLGQVIIIVLTSLVSVHSSSHHRVSSAVATESCSHTVECNQDPECNLDPQLVAEIASYKTVADRIISEVLQGSFKGRAYSDLETFVDTFGPRFSGTPTLEKAIDFMLDRMQALSLENVHAENVSVPAWVRGYEHAEMLTPRKKKLNILGLGSSVGTPMGGLEADILVVKNFTELEQRADEAKGKIVVYNAEFVDYLTTSEFRKRGAAEAAKVGAVASLTRSVGPLSVDTPHTGGTTYLEGVAKIPAACITIEDAELFQRYQNKGQTVRVRLVMNDYNLEPVISRNAVGDITGREAQLEKVLISAHIDSWDIGVGAMDDGGGVIITMAAVELLKQLNLRPRRTLSTVLWTAEEVGLVGAQAYLDEHMQELGNISVLLESDAATFRPLGLGFAGSQDAGCIIQEVSKLLVSLNASSYQTFEKISSDVDVFIPHGVPAISLRTDLTRRYWYHHTEADSLTVEDPEELDLCLATWAVTAYVLSDISVALPRGDSSKPYLLIN